MRKLEHIGIAVNNLAEANQLYARLLGKPHYKIEEVASEGVRTSFFKVGETKIELLEATSPSSPIAKFLEQRGQGVHHLAFEVEDIHASIRRLEQEGFYPISATPRRGADNKLVCFFHPRSCGGVLVELCQNLPAPDP
ncbi:MAG: methylmalonyl-CoA epimerase, partial [Saprospiraceae bacterium]|nr:methylmalonyl-CoA epimerase [Saprospiraceae bacterium]